MSEAMRTAFLGTEEHATFTIGCCVLNVAASASPDMLPVMNANPVRAPTIAGFASCALTCEPRFKWCFG